VIVLISIRLFFNPEKKRKPKASRKKDRKTPANHRKEPTLDTVPEDPAGASDPEFGDALADIDPGDQGELQIGDPAVETRAEPTPRAAPAGPPADKIVSLFLLARDNHVITGAELLQAMVSTGMEFGDMNIFHRIPEGSEQPLFSLANASKPGHFERDEWNTFETTGVVLFMTLPGQLQALDVWDSMLATARRMSEILQAELLDGERSPFTRQREAQLREEMRDYDRGLPLTD
jgi:cell division protein ZipA